MDEPDSAPGAPRGRWQFGLRHLFGLTTYAAAASALVVWFGPGTLMTSLGLLVAILNVRGVFARWQEGRTQFVLLASAWCLFLVSLALPCGWGWNEYIWGWEAAWVYLAGPFETLWGNRIIEASWWEWVWVASIDSANVLMVSLPILLWRVSRQRGKWYTAMLCVVMPVVWIIGWEGKLLVGYYIWCASFQLALVALPIGWRTLLAMLASGTLLLVLLRWYGVT